MLEWGGWSLNVAIARALELSPTEAEPIKRALSFTGSTATPDGFTEDQLTAGHEAARRQLQTFARELVSSLQFYQNQPGSLGIGEIVLTGGTTHLPGLSTELERLIGVPVRVADPFGAREGLEEGPRARSDRLIRHRHRSRDRGLARCAQSTFSLATNSPAALLRYRGVAFGGAGGVALVTVALTALMLGAGGAIQQQNAERDSLNAQLAALPTAPVDQAETEANAALASEKNAAHHRSVDRALDPGRMGSCAEPDLTGPAGGRLADEPHESVRPRGRRQRDNGRRRASWRKRHDGRARRTPSAASLGSWPVSVSSRRSAESTCCRARTSRWSLETLSSSRFRRPSRRQERRSEAEALAPRALRRRDRRCARLRARLLVRPREPEARRGVGTQGRGSRVAGHGRDRPRSPQPLSAQ